MSDGRGVVGQDTYPVQTEGNWIGNRANPRGELIMPDPYQQLVADGRVFQASNAAFETGTLGATAFTTGGVNPFLNLDIPSGTTVMPLELRLTQDGTVAGNAFDIYVVYENASLLSAAGTAVSVVNMRTDDPNATTCTITSLPTITAPSDDRALFSGIFTQNVDDPKHSDDSFHLSARDTVMPILVGPASLVIYAWVTGTAPTLFFRLVWWELASTALT